MCVISLVSLVMRPASVSGTPLAPTCHRPTSHVYSRVHVVTRQRFVGVWDDTRTEPRAPYLSVSLRGAAVLLKKYPHVGGGVQITVRNSCLIGH